MQRNIIIIGAGSLQIPLIEAAKEMGLGVVVFDMNAKAPGMALADRPVLMSTKDVEGCVREARRLRDTLAVHGVVTGGTDASRTVAAIAAALDLPGIRFHDAEAATNKVLMRSRLRSAGVPVPDFEAVWSLNDARGALDRIGLPAVLKPAENMGARGVIKISTREELAAAYRHARKYSPTGEMILEAYMSGPELSVDALAWPAKTKDGQEDEMRFRVTGIADRVITGEPFFIETGHNMPTALGIEIQNEAARIMRAGMEALGITRGAGKGDLKVTPDGIKIGELAARLSGGYMSSHTYPLHCGVNLQRAAIQIALGDEPEGLEERHHRVVIERGILAPAGKIAAIGGIEAMGSVAGVERVIITRAVGDVMQTVTSNVDKVGHVIASGETLAEAEAAARAARELFVIEVDDTFSLTWEQVEAKARQRFGDKICWVCKTCDGTTCASGVPGMGGVGRMNSFIDNSRALAEWKILPRYLREDVSPDTTFELFGRKFEHPLMAAPMTGAVTNMGGAVDEYAFARDLLAGCRDTGTVAWLGDGASPEKFEQIIRALEEVEGFGVLICKPRSDRDELRRRFHVARASGVIAVGIDIDAIKFKTMVQRGTGSAALGFDEVRRLRDEIDIPFVLKGIMSPADAEMARRAGVDAIVVSNHGGRILDDMPGTARVLPEVAAAAGRAMTVIADGGIRCGRDAFKMMALGAKAVLVGRTAAIAAVGGERAGVKFLFREYAQDLRQTMTICGPARLDEIHAGYVLYAGPPPAEPRRANSRTRAIDD